MSKKRNGLGRRGPLLSVAVVVMVGAGVVGIATLSRGSPPAGPAAVPAEPSATLGLDTTALSGSENLPLLPDRQIASLQPGDQFTIGDWGGVESVEVRVEGVEQSVSHEGEGYTATIDNVDGTGTVTMEVTQSFEDGTSMSIPVTSYIGTLDRHAERSAAALESSGEVVLLWGSDLGEIGISREGETSAASAVAVWNDSVVILDRVNQRLVVASSDGVLTAVSDLPGPAFYSLATTRDGAGLMAIDPINRMGFDVVTGEQFALPPIVRSLSPDTRYAMGDGNALYAASPFDRVFYSIGVKGQGTYAESGPIQRANEAGRVWRADERTVAVQADLRDEPSVVAFDAEDVAIIDSAQADGTVVLLVSVLRDGAYGTELVAVTGDHYRSVEVPFSAGISMTAYLAADDGVVTVASPADDGLHLLSYLV